MSRRILPGTILACQPARKTSIVIESSDKVPAAAASWPVNRNICESAVLTAIAASGLKRAGVHSEFDDTNCAEQEFRLRIRNV